MFFVSFIIFVSVVHSLLEIFFSEEEDALIGMEIFLPLVDDADADDEGVKEVVVLHWRRCKDESMFFFCRASEYGIILPFFDFTRDITLSIDAVSHFLLISSRCSTFSAASPSLIPIS
jgi:hypothetical protein